MLKSVQQHIQRHRCIQEGMDAPRQPCCYNPQCGSHLIGRTHTCHQSQGTYSSSGELLPESSSRAYFALSLPAVFWGQSNIMTSSSCFSGGTAGGFIFRVCKACQSNPLNQGCFFTSPAPPLSAPSRFTGSFSRSARMRLLISGDMCACWSLCRDNEQEVVFMYMDVSSPSTKNGDSSFTISYNRHPRDHQSVAKEWPSPRIISGDMYAGVPQMVKAFDVSRNRAIPKSTSLAYPVWSIMMFSGLRSRYTMLCCCRCSRANTTHPT
mmetsp:Transcript_50520/g.96501  ORF Transcript_50520/g.96501 Transcript_50520/m.96501 type:complete len:266 (-) Transcript_50520:277-1074(-)